MYLLYILSIHFIFEYCPLFIAAQCHPPVRGEWGGQRPVNPSDASRRHRSVALSSAQRKDQVCATILL